MHNCARLMVVVVLGAMLAWTVGCQSESRQPAPGALPTGLDTEIAPRLNASTYFAHGHLLERQGSCERACEQYRKALELSPNFLSARNRLGIALNKLGRHAEASGHFRTAIRENPTEAYLYNNLGFSLYLEGRYDAAEEALRQALELDPDYGRARMNRGVVLARLGRYDEALSDFTICSGAADAYYNLAVIQTEVGDFAEAAQTLELALQADPRLEAARQQLHLVARVAAEAEAAESAYASNAAEEAGAPSVDVLGGPDDALPIEWSGADGTESSPALVRLTPSASGEEPTGPPLPESSASNGEASPPDGAQRLTTLSDRLRELVAAWQDGRHEDYKRLKAETDRLLAGSTP